MTNTIDPKHPLLTGEYAIYTPPMDEMICTFGDWIDQRMSGGYIYGPSRFGKTRGIKWYIRAALEERFGSRLPLVVWNRPDSRITETEFWNALLCASKLQFWSPMKQISKVKARYLFKQQLITLATAAQQNYVSLMIDEAHDVTLNEWKWLLGLQNELDFEGYRFSVFSIGSHQIGFKPDYFARTGNAHIVARFFCADARFHGISNSEELAFVLNGYDEDSDWPPGTRTSYLKYFAPNEFAKNLRLVSVSDELWESFEELLPPEAKSGPRAVPMEIPMLHVAQTIEQVLYLLSKGEEWEEVLNHTNMLTMISKTGFSNHMRAIRW